MGQSKWAIVGAFALVAIAAARTSADESKQAATTVREAEHRIEATLEGRLSSRLEFIDTPLNTIMGVIADDYGLPIQFNRTALEAAAVSPDQAISVNLSDVTLRSAMELLLKNVQGLTFIVTDEVLLITTEDDAAKHLEVRVYRVDDLLGPTRPSAGGTGADFSVLAHAFTSAIEPESWADNGGGGGRLVLLEPGMMVVTQTQRAHRKIGALIDDLRKTKIAIQAGPPQSDDTTAAAAKPSRTREQRQAAAISDARATGQGNPFSGN